ncbi:MAG: hydroxymethylglutaryl-CoA lyase [Chitinophagaceae bacterium]|nr:MAG: hydroxymethylglutaryl-CoA lyase [Chitinophagaceae bacterium]
MHKAIRLVECPRDAMQGWKTMIPTATKIEYLNKLLRVGFDTLDFGSFVSPKAIPQMADTAEVLAGLDLQNTGTNLLAIIANERGAEAAVSHTEIAYLGFPFSVSETFQQRNTNGSIAEALERVRAIQQLCVAHNKQLVVYISMGFGNPYGDLWSEHVVLEWVSTLVAIGVPIISLADTVGLATPAQIASITGYLVKALPNTEIGVHLHATADGWRDKVRAAWDAGCRRFDGALKGIGGCPMADDELVGNMNTEWLLDFFREKGEPLQLNETALQESLQMAGAIFG